ncbi:long-chain-fatty-acid--CoA ligase [Mongoliimonas terrestris]|uniref:long-chain-fatty-acid--CoA ligase n=1 Tax=Mongoliimonas terrestris TaxID=1709001 RepID=UPI000949A671|nr:long-chain-fatty-acid--CoA ligase [Mongoliimonas terrestris]
MLGLMQDWPLLASRIIDHAAANHGAREIVTRSVEGPIHRTNYASVRENALKVAKRLDAHGVRLGDRVATLAWNTWRHLELWYGIQGLGAICHTVNPRLFPEQIAWIMNHAESRLLFTDLTFLPLVEKLKPHLPHVEQVIVLTDAAHLPENGVGAVPYESWIGAVDADFRWPTFDENTAAGLCYTSGTTGDPKGVLYSHRSNALHALLACLPDSFALSCRDTALPVVPMFHANCWGLAHAGPMVGARLVLPGAKMDGASIFELLRDEKVTRTAAVPTVWLMLLQHLDKTGDRLDGLERVVIGGSAAPRAMIQAFRDRYGIEVVHAWGMTETSPLGTLCTLKPENAHLTGEAWLDVREKQGFTPFGVEIEITDDEGRARPHDGETFGRLKVRGPAIARGYFRLGDAVDGEGWFDTGDVATIDPLGYMQITDRSKDVIKSGGEWISSIELENIAVGHPDVAEAAVIGVRHPKWDERPLLVVVAKEGRTPTRDSLLAFFEGKVAKWWLPDDVVVVSEIPHTATGKIRKATLREQFRDYSFLG